MSDWLEKWGPPKLSIVLFVVAFLCFSIAPHLQGWKVSIIPTQQEAGSLIEVPKPFMGYNRFHVVGLDPDVEVTQGVFGHIRIVTDTETGIRYMHLSTGTHGAAITRLWEK